VTVDLIDMARTDVLEGRRRLAAQERLVDDLLRIGCSALLPMAERLLRHTRERQQARERHLQDLLVAADLEGGTSLGSTMGVEVVGLDLGLPNSIHYASRTQARARDPKNGAISDVREPGALRP